MNNRRTMRGASFRGNRRRNRYEWFTFLAFAGPNLILFGVFTYWPILYSAYLSLTDWSLISATRDFVGFSNYTALVRDATFWKVGANTLVYALSVVIIAQILAFILAQLLNRPIPGRGFFRALAFSPHVTTPAAAALVWILILHPELGPLSIVYSAAGIHGPNWLASSALALWALVCVGAWKETAFATVFFLAGLQGLPAELYEAAQLETRSRWAVIRHITLPLMSPVLFFLSVTGLIAAMKTFDLVAIMTGGGPVYPASSLYVYHLYRIAFEDLRAGYASAFAVIFFGAALLITLVQFRAARRWVHDGE